MVRVRSCSTIIGYRKVTFLSVQWELRLFRRYCVGGGSGLIDIVECPEETDWRRVGGKQSKWGHLGRFKRENEFVKWMRPRHPSGASSLTFWNILLSVSRRPRLANKIRGSRRSFKLTKIGSYCSAHIVPPPRWCPIGSSIRCTVLFEGSRVVVRQGAIQLSSGLIGRLLKNIEF